METVHSTQEKKAYQSPVIVIYGDLETLTQGDVGTSIDGGGGTSFPA